MRYAAGNAAATGAMHKAVGKAFHGSTNNDKLTFEKPALKDESGNAAMVPAAAYGRRRHEDIGRACVSFGAGAANVAWRSRDMAFNAAATMRG
mmetsp:Transcript_17753/g.50040  ORF Transcript_17753/g.50040 Transcript_17753/m.50040 type:complete len:93 (-) Transcript_17753:217-495(-)